MYIIVSCVSATSVCFVFQSSVLFLQCGHICCCTNCSPSLAQCPLCRADIEQRIVLKAAVRISSSGGVDSAKTADVSDSVGR